MVVVMTVGKEENFYTFSRHKNIIMYSVIQMIQGGSLTFPKAFKVKGREEPSYYFINHSAQIRSS